jgi:hypothetical protein
MEPEAPILTVDSSTPSVLHPGQHTVKMTVHTSDPGSPGWAEFDCSTQDLTLYGAGTRWQLTPA